MTRTSPSTRTRGGTARQRSVAAAARAAAKRAERAEQARAGAGRNIVAGRTVLVGADERLPKAEVPPGRDGTGPAGPRKPAATPRAGGTAAPRGAAGAGRTDRAGTARTGRLRARPGLLRALLAGVTVALVAVTALLGLEYREAERTRQARTEATEAAREAAPVILSYDHRRLEKDFAAARGRLTGAFLEKFRRTTTTVVAPTARKYDGTVKATVAEPSEGGAPAVSVVSATPEEVVVLLFVNQVTESTKLSEPRVDLNRVRMTMADTPDGWKVRGLDAL